MKNFRNLDFICRDWEQNQEGKIWDKEKNYQAVSKKMSKVEKNKRWQKDHHSRQMLGHMVMPSVNRCT